MVEGCLVCFGRGFEGGNCFFCFISLFLEGYFPRLKN